MNREFISIRVGAVSTIGALVMFALSACASAQSGGSTGPDVQASGGATAASDSWFEERAVAAGVTHRFVGDADFLVGGGATAFDCDQDGDEDLFLAGGAGPARLFENISAPGDRIAFADRRGAVALALGDRRAHRVSGAYALDFDNDGDLDLFVMRFGRNALLENQGDCQFQRRADTGVAASGRWTTAFAAFWRAQDRRPTLVIGNYVDRDRPLDKTGNCEANRLLTPRNAPPGYVETTLEPSHCPLSMLFVDWRGDGAADLRISNDRQYYDPDGSEQLVTFQTGVPAFLGPDDGWMEEKIWGMGLAASDVDGDGRPEIAVSNMAENRLYRLKDPTSGRPVLEDVAWASGAAAQRPYTGGDPRPSTSWHNAFADFNNDGHADLLIVKGNVDSMPQFAAFDPDSLLLGRGDGLFEEAGEAAGVGLNTQGRGGAVADFNRDGLLDIVVVNRNQPTSLFENRRAADEGANWLTLSLRQAAINTRAVGASVEIVTEDGRLQRRMVTVGGGHAGGGGAAPIHVGLGAASEPQVRVLWPGGARTDWITVAANARYELIRKGDTDVEVKRRDR
ncbi:MAG: CRTAC1 family protein [Alphaproteobacteria bacterium]|nr:CRTAC1 family protein [Alphaproteobacteria bacterium]